MDTISRENNPSILPIAGLIAGALALVLSIVALVKLGALKKVQDDVAQLSTRVESVEGSARSASDNANRANAAITNITKQVQGAFDQVTAELGALKTEVAKLATAKPAPAPKGAKEPGEGGGKGGPGGDYTVKAGDTPAKIARAHGVSVDALMQANPGLEPTKLKVGQKINLPKGR